MAVGERADVCQHGQVALLLGLGDGFHVQADGRAVQAQRAGFAQQDVLVAAQRDLFGGNQPVAHGVVDVFANDNGHVQAAQFVQDMAVVDEFAAQIEQIGFGVERGLDVCAVADANARCQWAPLCCSWRAMSASPALLSGA